MTAVARANEPRDDGDSGAGVDTTDRSLDSPSADDQRSPRMGETSAYAMKRPILVTGSHRSGTTWVGQMLCRSGEAGYIHEPFNPRRRPGWGAGRVPYWFLYVTDENASAYMPVMIDALSFRYPILRNIPDIRGLKEAAFFARDLSHGLRGRVLRPRPLVKDPIALFSAEWLADTFDAQVVITIRHPAAFASSVKRLNWRFEFRGWLAQESLLRDRLGPYESDMRRLSTPDADIVDQAIVMWNAIHEVIHAYKERHPDWYFVRHEDLARAPVDGFQRLYDGLDLRWSDRVARKIARHSVGDRKATSWHHGTVRRDSRAATRSWMNQLTAAEITRIRDGCLEVWRLFYDESDWQGAPDD
jgi:Sulfotransferase family